MRRPIGDITGLSPGTSRQVHRIKKILSHRFHEEDAMAVRPRADVRALWQNQVAEGGMCNSRGEPAIRRSSRTRPAAAWSVSMRSAPSTRPPAILMWFLPGCGSDLAIMGVHCSVPGGVCSTPQRLPGGLGEYGRGAGAGVLSPPAGARTRFPPGQHAMVHHRASLEYPRSLPRLHPEPVVPRHSGGGLHSRGGPLEPRHSSATRVEKRLRLSIAQRRSS